MRRLVPEPQVIIEGALDPWYEFPDIPAGRSWVRGSFVMSLDGSIVGNDSRSGSLQNDVDRSVFPVLRRTSDVVLVGAGTVRAENYGPSRYPLAVVSASGQLPAKLRLFTEHTPDAAPALLVTTESAHVAAHITAVCEVLRCGQTSVDLDQALRRLRERGLSRVHCEGGPGLLSSLQSAGLLDEVVLTIAPTLVGGDSLSRLVTGVSASQLRFAQVLEENGTLLVRAVRTGN